MQRACGGAPQLLPVLERCAHAFRDDSRYTDDVRYLRVWISYADHVLDAEPIFEYLHDRRIGQEHALFYESWASILESKRKLDAADKVYTQGVLIKAQPLDRRRRRRAPIGPAPRARWRGIGARTRSRRGRRAG